MVGGKNKTAIRNATPEPFRDLLLSIARQAHNTQFNLIAYSGGSIPTLGPLMRCSAASSASR
jgi:hypothetical protein